jgi:hypothetical protein
VAPGNFLRARPFESSNVPLDVPGNAIACHTIPARHSGRCPFRRHTNSCLSRYAFSFLPTKHPQFPSNQDFFPPRLRFNSSKTSPHRTVLNLHLTWTPSSTDNHCTAPGFCARPCARGWSVDTAAPDASFRPFRKAAISDRCRARAAAPSGCSCRGCRGPGTYC